MASRRRRLGEVVTDPRLEPHLVLAGVLVLTLVVALVLLAFWPGY